MSAVRRVSLIIPTANRPHYLRQAVASALSQSVAPSEILVIDDREGANAAIADLRGPVRVIDNQRQGPVAARDRGVAAATGDVVAFLDDDDWFIDRDYLLRATDILSAGSDLCFGDGVMVFDDGRPDLPYGYDADASSLERDNTILISAVTYRRDLHQRLGRFDEALPYYWDWDWYLRVARAGARLTRLARPVVAIRVHGANMSGEQTQAARRANLDAFALKHGLGPLTLKNHLSLAQAPEEAQALVADRTG